MSKKKKATSKKLIPAVAYLRKSTIGKVKGKERQEKSIPRQKTEIVKLAKTHGYEVVRWYADPGKSGRKSGAARPDFTRMLDDAQHLQDFSAILCDDVDRFSRANQDEVQAVVYELRKVGVKFIITAAQGVYDLGAQSHDIGAALKFIVDAWQSNQHSRKLGRRMAITQLDLAKDGKICSQPPYALISDGKKGRKPGNKKEIAVVRRIYKEFVAGKSFRGIADGLTKDKIPTPGIAKTWRTQTVKDILERPAYKGDFVYGDRQGGDIYTAVEGEIVCVEEHPDEKKVGKPSKVIKGLYKAIIDPKLWGKAAKRRASFNGGAFKPRDDRFPLAGILVCGHCSKKMYGTEIVSRGHRVYRCVSNTKQPGSCSNYQIHEKDILPSVLNMMSEEISDLKDLLSQPPPQLTTPGKHRNRDVAGIQKQIDMLTKKIGNTLEDRSELPTKAAKKIADELIVEWSDELEELQESLGVEEEQPDYSANEWQAFENWYADFYERAFKFPSKGSKPDNLHTFSNVAVVEKDGDKTILWDDEGNQVDKESTHILVDPRIINEALIALGAEITLRWREKHIVYDSGYEKKIKSLVGGRFRLGQQKGKIKNGKDGVILCQTTVATRGVTAT